MTAAQHVITPEWGLLPRREFWVTSREASIEMGRAGSGLTFVIDAGFETDIATIPWWARTVVKPDDPRIALAAVYHDALLIAAWEQRTAAGEFYRVLRLSGVPRWKCVLMYPAVLAASDEW